MRRRLMFALLFGGLFAGNAGYLCAQQSDSFMETFRQGTINMSREIFEVVQGMHSVEDVNRAELKVAKVVSNFVVMLNGLGTYLDQDSTVMLEDLDALDALQHDPELKEWNEKVNEAMTKLQQEHPEAAARLTEILTPHSEKLTEAMTSLIEKLLARQMPMTDTPEESDFGND